MRYDVNVRHQKKGEMKRWRVEIDRVHPGDYDGEGPAEEIAQFSCDSKEEACKAVGEVILENIDWESA